MVKVLFNGATKGCYEPVMKKVQTANKKVGADALFCVGQFFGPGDPAADPDDWLVSVVTGDVSLPVATYFIGGHGAGCAAILEALPASDANLKYLGRAGVANVAGLTVAFLDGTFNAAAYHAEPSGTAAHTYSPYYTQRDVQHLKDALNQLEGEVDVLLTCDWPQQVAAGMPPNLVPDGLEAAVSQQGSSVVQEIVLLARPRYHVAGSLDHHFARLPYTNRDLGAGPRATRFVGLAHTDNPAKAKSLHALSLVPASDMQPEELSSIPDGSTPCPYDQALNRGVKRPADFDQSLPEGQDWRWSMRGGRGRGRGGDRGGGRAGEGGGRGSRPPPAVIAGRTDVVHDPFCTIVVRNAPFNATQADIVHYFSQAGQVIDVIRSANQEGKLNTWLTVQYDCKDSADKGLQLHNTEFMGRQITVQPVTSHGKTPAGPIGQAVDGCWFCLSSPSVDLNLVASVGQEVYLALDKGAITDNHVLLISVEHYPSSASLKPSCYAEVERYMSALRSYYAASGLELVAFERYLTLKKSGGNHCHINAIGVPPSAASRAEQVFQEAAQAAGFQLTPLPAPAQPGLSSQAALQAAVGECEYFLAILPNGDKLVRPILRGEKWPMALGREVLADLAGCPEKASWKGIMLGDEQEAARTEKFKAAFQEFDLVMQ